MKPDVLTRWLGAARRERVLRVLLSDYVLNGASCAFGMFVVSAIVHLLFGAEPASEHVGLHVADTARAAGSSSQIGRQRTIHKREQLSK